MDLRSRFEKTESGFPVNCFLGDGPRGDDDSTAQHCDGYDGIIIQIDTVNILRVEGGPEQGDMYVLLQYLHCSIETAVD